MWVTHQRSYQIQYRIQWNMINPPQTISHCEYSALMPSPDITLRQIMWSPWNNTSLIVTRIDCMEEYPSISLKFLNPITMGKFNLETYLYNISYIIYVMSFSDKYLSKMAWQCRGIIWANKSSRSFLMWWNRVIFDHSLRDSGADLKVTSSCTDILNRMVEMLMYDTTWLNSL